MPVLTPPITGEQVVTLPPAGPLTGLEQWHIVQAGHSRRVPSSEFLLQGQLDTDGAMAADSNLRVPSQHAVRLYVATMGGDVHGPGAAVIGNIAIFNDATGTLLADSGVDLADLIPISYLDTDPLLAANSNTKIATQAAVKAYADNVIAAQDAMVFKGVIDCSGNPNYPAAERGWTYRVSVAGRIGGGAGPRVEAGDILLCLTDSSPSGDQATVGANWSIIQVNIDGAVIGPASAADGQFAGFDGVTGKLIKALTAAQATAGLNNFVGDAGAGGTKGLVPAPAAGDAASQRFLKADGTWAIPLGAGDVQGPVSATDEAIARYNGGTGKIIQNSSVTIDDAGNLTATLGNIFLSAGDIAFTLDTRGVHFTSGGTKSMIGNGATIAFSGATGGYTFTTGPIVLISGHLAFPSVAIPSADPTTLDDYREFTWTPNLRFGGAGVGITYTAQVGRGTKVGDLVILFAQVTLSNKGSSTGSATLENLPFTVTSAINCSGVVTALSGFSGLTAGISGNSGAGGTVFALRAPNTTGSVAMNETGFTNTSSFYATMPFKT